MKCPQYRAQKKQGKAGFNCPGTQVYPCGQCQHVYTAEPKPSGYPNATRMLAVGMYVEGDSFNAIGRILKANPQSMVNWR